MISKVLVPSGAKVLLFKSLAHILLPSLQGIPLKHSIILAEPCSTCVMSHGTQTVRLKQPKQKSTANLRNLFISKPSNPDDPSFLLSSLAVYLSVKETSGTHHQPPFGTILLPCIFQPSETQVSYPF